MFIQAVDNKKRYVALHKQLVCLVYKAWCDNFDLPEIYAKDYEHYFELMFSYIDNWLNNTLQGLVPSNNGNTHLVEFKKDDLQQLKAIWLLKLCLCITFAFTFLRLLRFHRSKNGHGLLYIGKAITLTEDYCVFLVCISFLV